MVSCTKPWCARGQGAGFLLRRRLHASLAAIVGASLLGVGCASDDSPTDNPFRTPVAPTDLRIARASTSEVELTWVHDDTDETGFIVTRQVGSPPQSTRTFELPPDTEGFTDPAPHPTLLLTYAVQARYGSTVAAAPQVARVDVDYDPPLSQDAFIADDSVTVRWLPPDFTTFDGFQIQRIVERRGDALVDSTFQLMWLTSEEVRWKDGNLPMGEILDRMVYQVTTRGGSALSPPVLTPRFQWSLPTIPDAFAIAVSHEVADARFVESQGLAPFSYVREDGEARSDIIDLEAKELDSRYHYRVTEVEGWVSGAAPSRDFAVFAHAPPGSQSVTLRGIDVAMDTEAWTLAATAPVPFVTEGPAVGTVLYPDGTDLVEVAGATGTELSRTPIGITVALAGVVQATPARVAVVETRPARGAEELRVSLREISSGTTSWAGPWQAGGLLPGGGSLVVSYDHSLIALNVQDDDEVVTTVMRAASGAIVGSVEGRTVGFTGDGTRALVVESASSPPRAFRAGDSLVAEDLFGAAGVTASFLADGDQLWMFHVAGTIRVYTLVLGWGKETAGPADMPADGRITETLDAGVPRFEMTGAVRGGKR